MDYHDRAALEAFCRERHIDRIHVRRFVNGLCKRFVDRDEALESLDPHDRGVFADALSPAPLTLVERHDSRIDGATKLLFQTRSGLALESVILRIASGRTSLCVSSQVGCAAGCTFCATGAMPITKNLSASEILEQVVQAGRLLRAEGRDLRNVVFMGMGEPFHNERALYAALERLHAPDGFARSPARTLISTVGIPEAMVRCVRRNPDVRLALSLHSADQTVRESIVPLARRYPLDDLSHTVREANRIQKRPLMIEYILLRGVNDRLQDADALIRYLEGLDVHVNLIPFNPIPSAPHLEGTPESERRRFSERLKAAGLRTTSRYSLGQDIAAACGQLVQQTSGSGHSGRLKGRPGSSRT